MAGDIYVLLNLLEEEFRDFADVRLRPVFQSKTTKSPDLPQDYDPESSTLHLVQGVYVSTRTKEFFFPVEWLHHNRAELLKQVESIREEAGAP